MKNNKTTNKSGKESNQKLNIKTESTNQQSAKSGGKSKPTLKSAKDILEMEKRIKKFEEEIKMLAFTIDEVEDEKQDVENKLKKVLADYQNLEARIDKRIDAKSVQMKKQLAGSLMVLMDDIQFGVAASDDLELAKEAQAWLEGMVDTVKKMENVLLELDITLLKVEQGDQFDSNVHEAIATIPSDQDNKIVEVVQPGYMMGDLVVRPARVVVGKKQ